jgi:hypothetical protein
MNQPQTHDGSEQSGAPIASDHTSAAQSPLYKLIAAIIDAGHFDKLFKGSGAQVTPQQYLEGLRATIEDAKSGSDTAENSSKALVAIQDGAMQLEAALSDPSLLALLQAVQGVTRDEASRTQ